MDVIQKLESWYNFSFVVEDKLAGMSRPDKEGIELIREIGVQGILSLTESSIPRSVLSDMEYLHLPVADFTAPDMNTLEHAVSFIDYVEGPVVVHCHAGIGRTGTVIAAYLVATGMEPDKAVREIRRIRPSSIETPSQENAVYEFDVYLRDKQEEKTGEEN